LTGVVYAAVRTHGFLHFDDNTYVVENGAVRAGLTWQGVRWALTAPYAGNWHPLTWVSHMIDVQLYGMDAGWHHLTNLFLHIATTVLLLRVLVRMTGAVATSALVAALFALHPLHVESVAWIAERKDVLSTFWWVLTITAYAAYVRQPRVWRYATVAVCFALALMSKPMVVTLPFVLLLLDVWPLRRWDRAGGTSGLWALVKEKTLLFLMAGGATVVTFIVQRQAGAVQSLDRLPVLTRVAGVPVAYVHYLLTTLWPIHLAPLYPYPSSIPWWEGVGALAVLVVLSVLAIRSFRSRPYVLVGWCWFLGTLAPVNGLVQVGSALYSDRHTYVAAIGLFIIVAWLARDWVMARPALSRPVAAGAAVVVIGLAALSYRQVQYWKDNVTLWEHTVAVTGDNYRGQTNLGFALAQAGERARAVEAYREALRLNPSYPQAHNYYGLVLADMGDHERAAAEYEEALRLLPRFAEASNNLGLTRVQQEQFDLARQAFTAALTANPAFVQARNNLAIVYARQGDYAHAIAEFEEVIRQTPSSAEAQMNLASALAEAGRKQDALAHFETAARLGGDPAKVHQAWGGVLMDLGNMPEAAAHFQTVLNTNPRSAEALHDLGRALALSGRLSEGVRALQMAVQIQPGDADYHHDFGAALARSGRINEAIAEMQTALRINPAHVEAQEALRLLIKK
jgi:tetratricopeptide (TPR) repeat protein